MNRFYTLLITLLFSFVTRLYAQQGVVDSSFGTDGCVATFFGDGDCMAYGVAITTDGKIITGGYGGNAMLVARYASTGVVDSGFAYNGVDMPTFGWSGEALGYAMAMQQDGKIVLAGLGATPNLSYFSVARFNSNGFADSTFGVNGQASTNVGPESLFGVAKAIAIQPDGKIIVAGISYISGHDREFALARFDSSGVIDSSFGINGVALPGGGAGTGISAMVLQPDGKILAGGGLNQNPLAVIRLLSNGTPDSTYGTNGMTNRIWPESSEYGITGLALQPNGSVIAVGDMDSGQTYQHFAVARFDSTGHVDPTFGKGGWTNFAFGTNVSRLCAVAIQTNGRIVGAGACSFGPSALGCSLVRYNYDGSPDSTFATNGIAQTSLAPANPGGDFGIFNTVMVEPNNDIFAAGSATYGTGSGIAIVRYLNNLALGVVNLSSPSKQLLVYPNPINQNAVLSYELSSEQQITLRITNATGRVISTFVNNEWQQAGTYHQNIRMPDYLAHGVYFVVLSSLSGSETVQVVK